MRLTELEKYQFGKTGSSIFIDPEQRYLDLSQSNFARIKNFGHIEAHDPGTGEPAYLEVALRKEDDVEVICAIKPSDGEKKKAQIIAVLTLDHLSPDEMESPIWKYLVRVMNAGVTRKYQGQKIGQALYVGAVTFAGYNLISRGLQSKGSQKLWFEMYQNPAINVYVYSDGMWSDPSVFQATIKGNQLAATSNGQLIDIYRRRPDTITFSLIATAKNSKLDRILSKMKKP